MMSQTLLLGKLHNESNFWRKRLREQKSDFVKGIIRGLAIGRFLAIQASQECHERHTMLTQDANWATAQSLYMTIKSALTLLKGGDRGRGIVRLEKGLEDISTTNLKEKASYETKNARV